MKQTVKSYIIYAIIIALSLYVLPMLIQDTGSAMAVLLTYIPGIVFITSLICGVKTEVPYVLPAIVALLFMPTIIIYYNFSAMVYVFVYYFISLIGVAVGRLIRKLGERKKKNDGI